MPWSAAIRAACVPLPEPCGPSTRRFTEEPLRKLRIIICDSIWRIVSSATPTAMSTDVPPSAPADACEKPP